MGLVSCNLLGRFANQAMIAACCVAYALRHGLEYHIPAHTLNDSVWKPMFTHLENSKWNENLPTVTLRESQHNYQELPFIEQWREGNIIIDGYRQSIKYFEDYLPEVRKAFGFDYGDYSYTIYGDGNSFLENICAIHVRRGDYLLYPDKHPVVNDFYLLNAINYIAGKRPENFIFFSDDIEWCKQFVKRYENLFGRDFSFQFSEGQTEINDFKLMMGCKNFIISNSTYSLMAAILSESPNKICISPSKDNWFGEGNKNLSTETIIPDNFIQIKY